MNDSKSPVSVRKAKMAPVYAAQQQMAQQQIKRNESPNPGIEQTEKMHFENEPGHNVSAAVATLGEMVKQLASEVGALEAIMRAHMPNNLYDQKADSAGSIGVIDSGFFGNVVLSSPIHSDLVIQLNEMWRVVEHLRYLQKHVVV